MNAIILSVTLQQIVPIYPDLSSAPAPGGWWAIPTQKGAKIPMNARPTETADPSSPVPGMEVAIGNVSTHVTGLNVAEVLTNLGSCETCGPKYHYGCSLEPLHMLRSREMCMAPLSYPAVVE